MARWTLVLLFASCYRAGLYEDCTLSCADGACPEGLRCGTSGLCSATHTCPGDTPNHDGGPDGPSGCFGGGLIEPQCLEGGDEADVTMAETLDTDDAGQCSRVVEQAGGPELCVVRASNSITVATLRATGDRALVLVAPTISVAGVLDVSAGGAGSRLISDSVQNGNALNDGGLFSGAGGAGGSLAGRGGDGGATTRTGLMVVGGVPPAKLTLPAFVLGGLNGGDGGRGSMITPLAPGGSGGGAVYLAADTITVSGLIDAGGGGGGGAVISRGGGGGGGSGGMIVLDANSVVVTISGKLIAAGGAGGGGASSTGTGMNGGSPSIAATTAALVTARGGVSLDGIGGDGNDGSQIANDDGAPGKVGDQNNVGGGGGGGGAGFIRMFATSAIAQAGSVIAPAHAVETP